MGKHRRLQTVQCRRHEPRRNHRDPDGPIAGAGRAVTGDGMVSAGFGSGRNGDCSSSSASAPISVSVIASLLRPHRNHLRHHGRWKIGPLSHCPLSQPVRAGVRRDRDGPAARYGSTPDSRLEGDGFELPVPRERRYRALTFCASSMSRRTRAEAQDRIGRLYEEGWGVAQDYGEAMRWYRKAEARGEVAAQSSIGWLYENGWAWRGTMVRRCAGTYGGRPGRCLRAERNRGVLP